MSIITIQLVTQIDFDTEKTSYEDLTEEFKAMVAEINNDMPMIDGATAILAKAVDITNPFNHVVIAA